MSGRVLVVGGLGFFGRLLVAELLRETEARVVVGGRRRADFEAFRGACAGGERLSFTPVDLRRTEDAAAAVAGADLAVCAAGPSQGLPPTLAQACLGADVPYLDLADDRAFVARARALARPEGPTFFPGCSTSPALTAALTAVAVAGRGPVDTIRVALAAGNAARRQEATIASLLESVGAPLRLRAGAGWRETAGWTEPAVFAFPPPIGPRTGRLVDVADHDLLPALFGAQSAEFRVAPEFAPLGGVLAALGGLRRRGLLGDLRRWTSAFRLGLAALSGLGHEWGALGVEAGRRVWLVADHEAPAMAVLPAVVMARRILAGAAPRGLVPLADWLPRAELERECARRGWRLVVEEDAR